MLVYFLSTRVLHNPSQLALFLVQFIVPTAILAEIVQLDHAGITTSTLSALLGFVLVYEAGYLYNDFFDSYGARKRVAWLTSRWVVLVLIGANFAIVLIGFALNSIELGNIMIYMIVFVAFVLHTALAPKNRVITFIGLNFSKVAFVGATITDATPLNYIAVALAIVLPQAWKYWARKSDNAYVPSNWLSMLLSLGCAFAISLTVASVVSLAMLAILFSIAVRRKRSESVARSRDLVSHSHTELSHDAAIHLSDYERIPHHIYLTDHAEDVDAQAFNSLRRDADAYPGKFTVGLEFPWSSEHILAVNLTEPLMHPIQSLEALSKVTDELIWAHPDPSIRQLITDPQYRRKIWNIFTAVDSVEWYNIKSMRRGTRFGFRNSLWATIFHLMKGAKRFYVGADLHHVRDFDNLAIATSYTEDTHNVETRDDRL